ncbi:unnamed protein product [Rangifer tarandus platyrhynchus]|uniref:Uncharacterized protein n=1 Tax=Rangifer tarandus platyrhynchus TaxID=3082113 RepID=A0ABN8Y366_RANTA|nr:unnamed protein product [Rangifer tarandus platyrhynchus]
MDGAGQLWNPKAGRYPMGGRCIPSLGILAQEPVRLGSCPGGSQWLSMALPLAPPFPTWIPLLLFSLGERLTDLGSLAEPSPNKPCLSPGISGTLKSSVQRNAVGEGAKQLCSRLPAVWDT